MSQVYIESIRKWWEENWNQIFKCPLAKTCCTPIRHIVNPSAETIPNYADEVCKTDEHKKCIYYIEFKPVIDETS